MNFTIRTIPAAARREAAGDTTGDWVFQDGALREVTVVSMDHEDSEFCVGIHEAIEAWLCRKAGITMEQVDAFDTAWVEHDDIEEAGDDPIAPYYTQHQFALEIEKRLCRVLGMPWREHNDRVMEA